MSRVFVSWSRPGSEKVGQALREWLPLVVQSAKPFLSTEDIEKGARWNSELTKELQTARYGIVCITPENVTASWLNFEAGALSMAFPVARISPFLVGVSKTEITGPLTQFQMTAYEKADVQRLVHSVNGSSEDEAVERERIDEIFDAMWPRLVTRIDPIVNELAADAPQRPRPDVDVLGEILETVRNSARVLSSPSSFLPPSDLYEILADSLPIRPETSQALQELLDLYHVARRNAMQVDLNEAEEMLPALQLSQVRELCTSVKQMRGPLDILLRKSGIWRERASEVPRMPEGRTEEGAPD